MIVRPRSDLRFLPLDREGVCSSSPNSGKIAIEWREFARLSHRLSGTMRPHALPESRHPALPMIHQEDRPTDLSRFTR